MTTTPPDPFAPPASAIGPATRAEPGDFFAVFLRWEKYRLVYNGILGLTIALVVATRPPLLPRVFSHDIPTWIVVANVGFCLGPVLNGYAWWVGLRGRWVGRIILAAGTVPSIVLTAGLLRNA